MNQSARPQATSDPGEERRDDVSALKSLDGGLTLLTSQARLLKDNFSLIRPQMLPLALPGVLCALALLFIQRAPVHWLVAICTLLMCLSGLAAMGALVSSRRAALAANSMGFWSALRPQNEYVARRVGSLPVETYALRLGVALLALAALFAAPIVFTGPPAAMLAMGLEIIAFSLYGVDVVRQRIAPFDEIIAPLCLGPGLMALTIVAQGQRLNGQDWLVAAALGFMALALVEGRRLRADIPDPQDKVVSADEPEATGSGRTLGMLIGRRRAALIAGGAMAIAYILTLLLSLPRNGAPGALLALTSLPVAVIGLSGVALSAYEPARRAAADQMARVYNWYGLALAAGLTLTAIGQQVAAGILRTLGL